MAKVLLIVNKSGFHSEEIDSLKTAFRYAKHSVKIAAITRTKIVSSDDSEFLPDIAIYEANPNYFDVVVVLGQDTKELAKNRSTLSLIRNVALKEKIVGGITMGSLVLAAAGILGGRRATICPERDAIRELREANARYESRHVVRDGNIITADDPESAEEFLKEIIKMIG